VALHISRMLTENCSSWAEPILSLAAVVRIYPVRFSPRLGLLTIKASMPVAVAPTHCCRCFLHISCLFFFFLMSC